MPTSTSKQCAAFAALRDRDYATAAALARDLAETGEVYGKILLARLYSKGLGVERDLAAAERLLDEAELLGSIEAAYQKTGIFALRGEHDRYFAAAKKAALAGSLPAKCTLGRCYLWGIGVSPDEGVGESLLVQAAEQGSIGAKAELAFYRKSHSRNFFEFLREMFKAMHFGWRRRYLRHADPGSDKL